MGSKLNLGILCGGKSAEHEVSLNSARNVFQAVDRARFDPYLIGIDRQNVWHILDSVKFLSATDDYEIVRNSSTVGKIFCLPREGGGVELRCAANGNVLGELNAAFPVLHGTYGEDGCMQGYLKLLGLPFVGPGVLSSALNMDKEVMKRLLVQASIPTAKFVTLFSYQRQSLNLSGVIESLGLPCFVKPANLGSSVGISKARNEKELAGAVELAFRYDVKIIVEEFVNGREIECAILGNEDAQASLPGEIIPSAKHGFYSYDAKYTDAEGAKLEIPAKLTQPEVDKVKQLALRAYKTLDCEGLSRVDMFLKANGELLINEINTIPGFTNISMYPKLWGISGIKYSELISKLVDLALVRYQRESSLETSFFKD